MSEEAMSEEAMSEEQESLCIAVSGGTGFVGSALLESLVSKGMRVKCITRSTRNSRLPDGVQALGWDELTQGLADVDVIVHLAGAPAVGQRLTEERKKVILDSRVETTKKLVDTMSEMAKPPSTFICASAIGYYGARAWGDICTEKDAPGDDFLAQVCVQWEKAARSATALGVRVVHTRIGVVFGDGGALHVMAQPFKWFVGGPIAGGQQPVSWIDRRDAVRALLFCIENESMRGAVNLVSPQATTNGELSSLIASTLGRPNLFPVPEFALRMLFLEGAEPITTGQHVAPSRLVEAGFEFEHPDLVRSVKDSLSK